MSTRHHWWPRVSLSKIITFMWRSYMNTRKTDKEWAGFQPLDEQLGTSLGMSAECPAAIPSVGEHEVQHESTVCWEFAPFLWTSSCLPQLSADAACERSNRTGQNNTPRNQNRWEKNGLHKEACSTDLFKSPVTGSNPFIQIAASVLLIITGSMDELLNGPTGHRPRATKGQGATWPEPLFYVTVLWGEKANA